MDVPKFKKKVNDFMLNEEGKISKQSIVAIGGLISAIGVSSIASQKALAGAPKTNADNLTSICAIEQKASVTHPQHFNCGEHKHSMTMGGNIEARIQHDHHYNHANYKPAHCSHNSHGSGGWW
jgi:hypothetical protein